jgi:hypothetical protein
LQPEIANGVRANARAKTSKDGDSLRRKFMHFLQ